MACSRGEPSDSDAPEDVSLLFRALANEYRRAVVRALDETHTPVTRTALATYVAKEVLPESERANFIGFRRQVVASLYHVHLPLLERAGVIETEAGQILLGRAFPAAVALTEAMS